MKETAIIFGIDGQDGQYLTKLLSQEELKVIGVGRKAANRLVDLNSFLEVKNLIQDLCPQYIFHLAANSTTSHQALIENNATIVNGSINILEAVYQAKSSCKVFLSGSGLQFKNTGCPINETAEFELSSAYSLLRTQSVLSARYFRNLGVKTYVGYFFNHDSPLRSERHVTQKIASAVARIQLGSAEKIKIGDASVRKEWGFAGDIVKAVWTLVQQDEVFECTIGTGEAFSIQEWIDRCFEFIGKESANHIEFAEGFEAEYRTLVSDPSTIKGLGWKPEVTFSELAEMMILGHEK